MRAARVVLVIVLTLAALTGWNRPAAAHRAHAAVPGFRWIAMRLDPEMHAHVTEQQRRWTVVALGDSVPAGTACSCRTFVDLYAATITRDTGVPTRAVNEAAGGLDTASQVAELSGSGPAAAAVAHADFVLLTIGANDFRDDRAAYLAGACGGPDDLACFRARLPQFAARLAAILARIHSLAGSRPLAVRVLTYWNLFEDGQVALDSRGAGFVKDTDRVTRMVNAQIARTTREVGDICVDTYGPFKGDDGGGDPTAFLAADGDHPNARGHELIASAVADAGFTPIF